MRKTTNEKIGAKVRALRTKAGLRQQDLGDKIGVSSQSIAKYEKGQDAITAVRLVDIAIALKCKTQDLIP